MQEHERIDFLKYAKPAFIAPVVIVLIGVGALVPTRARRSTASILRVATKWSLSFEAEDRSRRGARVAPSAGVPEVNLAYTKLLGGEE
jgi:hypothetical protein